MPGLLRCGNSVKSSAVLQSVAVYYLENSHQAGHVGGDRKFWTLPH